MFEQAFLDAPKKPKKRINSKSKKSMNLTKTSTQLQTISLTKPSPIVTDNHSIIDSTVIEIKKKANSYKNFNEFIADVEQVVHKCVVLLPG